MRSWTRPSGATTQKIGTIVDNSMAERSEHDKSNPNDNSDDVDYLTKQMAKLWWPDTTDQEPAAKQMAETTPASNNGNREFFGMDKAKQLATLSIQTAMQKVWAKELYEMDAREREDITNEIHGVQSNRAIRETAEIISEGVRSLRDSINQIFEDEHNTGDNAIPPVVREAYKRVVASELLQGDGNKVPYIRTKSFLLKFLRVTYFDVKKARQRYLRFLDLMHELHGDIGLKRPLMMTDLTIREMRYLKKGQMQLLPSRDRVGRRIFAFSGRVDRSFTVREKYRTMMYIFDVCSEDEATQKLGLVGLMSPKIDPGAKPFGENGMALRSTKEDDLGGLSEHEYYTRFNDAKHLRYSAIHYFGPDTLLYRIGTSLVLFLLGKEHRKIVRFHGGSQMECNYSLRSFGIPSDEVPVTDEGQIKNKKVSKFIAARKSIEAIRLQQYTEKNGIKDTDLNTAASIQTKTVGIECPEVNCIMFGNRARHNIANLEFRNILKVMQRNREESLARNEKTPSAKEFIFSVIEIAKSPEHNLRFFAVDRRTSLFEEIEDSQELYSTVSQALRDQRKRTRLESRLTEAIQQQNYQAERHEDDRRFISESDGGGSDVSILSSDGAKRRKGLSKTCC